jgi:hypothetical protein
MNTFPPTGYPVRIGVVSFVNSSTGSIYINQSNAFVQASSVVGTLAIANGGTGQTTANAAFNALAPSQTGNSGKYLTTDGSNSSWATNPLGTVTSVGGTGTVSGITLTGTVTTSGNLTLGGTLDLSAYNGAGAFTTLSASSTVTLSGGTANGVTYLNGSKVLTSGSALTFNGSTFGVGALLQVTAPSNTRYSDFNTTSAGYGFSSFSYNGTAYGYIAQASSSFGGGSNTDFAVNAVNNLIFGANNVEKMRISNATGGVGAVGIGYTSLTSVGDNGLAVLGNVGVGTSAPLHKFQVNGTAARKYVTPGNSGAYAEETGFVYGNDSSTPIAGMWFYNAFSSNSATQLSFKTSNSAGTVTEAIRVDASQNVGIGTSSPAYKLDVSRATTGASARFANSTSYGQVFIESAGTNQAAYLSFTPSGTGNAIIQVASGDNLQITQSGNMGLGVAPSAWQWPAFQTQKAAISGGVSGDRMDLSQNYFRNGGASQDQYIGTGYATNYRQITGQHQWFNAPSGTAGGLITFTQAMTLTAAGELLVGVTTANTTLHVQGAGTTDGSIKFNEQLQSTGAYNSSAQSGSMVALKYNTAGDFAGMGGWSIGKENATNNDYSSYFAMHTRPNGGAITERARITSDGNLLLGTMTNSARLYVVGGAAQSALLSVTTLAGYAAVQGQNSNNSATGYVAYFANSGSGTGLYISNTAAWQSTSDVRLKTDVKDLDSTARLMALRPVDYLWKSQETSDEPTKRNLGFIAQEVKEVFPELVGVSPDGMFSVEYTGLIAPLVKAIQEQQAIIESLKARLDAANL